MDLDWQKANTSFFVGVDKENITTMADVFKKDIDINSCIVNVKENLDIIPAGLAYQSRFQRPRIIWHPTSIQGYSTQG